MELIALPFVDHVEQLLTGLEQRGYAYVDGFLDPDICAGILVELQEELSQGQFHKAGVGKADDYQVIHTLRGDYIKWLEKEETQPFTAQYLDKVEALRLGLNRHCFLGLQDVELHMTQYPPGTGYAKHVDSFSSDDNRRISIVFYLNFEWEEGDGGQLLIYPAAKPEVPVSILPIAGRVAIFESGLEHEVLPGGRKRYSITGWLLREKRFF